MLPLPTRFAFGFLMVLASSPASFAETKSAEVYVSLNPEEMAEIIRDIGYRAEILTNDAGKKRIRTRIGRNNANVLFYDCQSTNENCTSIQLRVVFDKAEGYTTQVANAWNHDRRFVKIYLDKDEDIVAETDILVDGGITREAIKANIDFFEDELGRIKGHFDQTRDALAK